MHIHIYIYTFIYTHVYAQAAQGGLFDFFKKKIGDKCSHIGRTAGSLTILSNMCMVHQREERGIKKNSEEKMRDARSG